MKRSGKQLILISFILAVLAAGAIYAYLHSLSTAKVPTGAVKKTTVLVAAEAIPSRTKIDKKMVTEIQVSDDSIFGDYIKDSSQIIGKYAKESISKNEGFNKDKLYSTDGSELSADIQKNHRAVSLNATGDSAVSYLIKPGDFVDIIVYLPEKKDGTKAARPEIAKLMLQNIKVLAIDRSINRDDKAPDTLPSTFLVTLSIETGDLEKIVLAESIGSLKLALRPIDNENNIETNGTKSEELLLNDPSPDQGNTSPNGIGGTSSEAVSYKVKRGDTLKSISTAFYGDPDKYTLIEDANNIQDKNLIITGEVLKIPPKTE